MCDFIFFIFLYSSQISTINIYIYNLEVMKKIKMTTLESSWHPKVILRTFTDPRPSAYSPGLLW